MRHNLLLLSAFTVAAALSLGAPDAEAASKERTSSRAKVTQVAFQKSASEPVQKTARKRSSTSSPVWAWNEARLTALFVKDDDGGYHVEELPGAKNADVKLPIASIAKLAAAAVIFDAVDNKKIKMTDMVPVRPETWTMPDSKFAVVGLPKGLKEIPVEDALVHTLKLSSNPMTRNLAVFVAGSNEAFVALMNAKAKEWGMDETNFVTPDGLPDGNRKQEHTTAKDMLKLAAQMAPNLDRYREYTNGPMRYWNDDEKPSKKAVATANAKDKLTELGSVFKTGTVNGCQSLLNVTEVGDTAVADIQLCAKKGTRFSRAYDAVKGMFTKAVSGQMVGPERPTIISAVSSRPVHPSDP